MQITELRKLHCESDIRSRLGKLLKTLKTAYDELYSKIESQEGSAPIIAKRAFQWVMCSYWPLSPAELIAAVFQNPDTDGMDEVYVNTNFVLDACQNLLVVDQELDVCRFSHLSVQEYFETHHWSSCETDFLVAKVCLSLLINNSATSIPDPQSTKKISRDKTHDFLEYASLHWASHVQKLEEKRIVDNSLTEPLNRFLGSMDQSSPAYQNWYDMVEKLFEKNLRVGHRDFYRLPLYQVHKRLSPSSRASFAIATFRFYETILD